MCRGNTKLIFKNINSNNRISCCLPRLLIKRFDGPVELFLREMNDYRFSGGKMWDTHTHTHTYWLLKTPCHMTWCVCKCTIPDGEPTGEVLASEMYEERQSADGSMRIKRMMFTISRRGDQRYFITKILTCSVAPNFWLIYTLERCGKLKINIRFQVTFQRAGVSDISRILYTHTHTYVHINRNYIGYIYVYIYICRIERMWKISLPR